MFFPIFLIMEMPFAWVKSLYYSRKVLGRDKGKLGFCPRLVMNNYYYKTMWVNLEKYGRTGDSSLMGLGNYKMADLWYLPTSGITLYAKFGAMVTLLGTLFWAFSNLIWLHRFESVWVIAITLSLFLSSTSYVMAFARQNYQILGWMWYPLSLFSFDIKSWVMSVIFTCLFTIGGVTQVFL